ncbi:hypothetical protein EUGRSUZ_C03682 [Eucalyptus grandis]|uniref:Uncharacterized protein n=2 Tax=Eucalyptus grandis TaxID=71139 RepID=A0ACC3LIX6_EUCGR|nr:hypothetical protein EUGRSUZ_C03682 [Eucalyptus grandis]
MELLYASKLHFRQLFHFVSKALVKKMGPCFNKMKFLQCHDFLIGKSRSINTIVTSTHYAILIYNKKHGLRTR